MKKTWQGIKEIININNRNSTKISQLSHDGKQLSSDEEMANAFNNFFTNVGPNLDKKIPNPRRDRSPAFYLKSRIPTSFLISPTSATQIKSIYFSLTNKQI